MDKIKVFVKIFTNRSFQFQRKQLRVENGGSKEAHDEERGARQPGNIHPPRKVLLHNGPEFGKKFTQCLGAAMARVNDPGEGQLRVDRDVSLNF